MGKRLFRGERIDPDVDVVSFYADQFPIWRHGPRRIAAIRRAAVQRSTRPSAGRTNAGGRCRAAHRRAWKLSSERVGPADVPRKNFSIRSSPPCGRSNRFVPIFNDKQPLVSLDWAKAIYDEASNGNPADGPVARAAGAARRRIEVPRGAKIEEAVQFMARNRVV